MSTSISSPFRRLSGPTATILAGAAMLAAVATDVSSATAADLIVKYDQSQLLRLPRPAADIIIGNPTIADVSIQGGNLLVVTGKAFGITNIIILDADKNIIQDQRIMVERDVNKIVHLQKGVNRQSWNCSPQCNPTVTVGDEKEYFTQAMGSATQKAKNAEGGSDGGGAGSGGN
jgi:Flp pilus assembly secretin CpaC